MDQQGLAEAGIGFRCEGCGITVFGEPAEPNVCSACVEGRDDEMRAAARLADHAPQLLAALKVARNLHELHRNVTYSKRGSAMQKEAMKAFQAACSQIDTAIAAATGETK